jgi:hypothetical protein
MWNVNPRFLCRAHLLGEHRELHMLAGALRKGVRLQPLVAQGLVEPYAVQARHDLLVAEMEARGFRHRSPLAAEPFAEPLLDGYVCEAVSRAELARRCEYCRVLQQAAPYVPLGPPHQCDAACAERVRRDQAARPAVPNGIAPEQQRPPGDATRAANAAVPTPSGGRDAPASVPPAGKDRAGGSAGPTD